MTTITWTRRSFLGALAAVPVAATLPTGAWASTEAVSSKDMTIGFVLDRDRIKRINLPGNGFLTALLGITNGGRIVGKTPGGDGVGFDGLVGDVRKLRRFSLPGAMATYANKVSEGGQIAGSANRTAPEVGSPGTFGYLLDRGRVTRIARRGAVYTQALGINDRNQVVGEYLDDSGVFHGFRWKKGRFTTFKGPRGSSGSLTDINDRGDMVGAYYTDDGRIRGFRLRNGRYTTFGAFGFPYTIVTDINNRGQIAGYAFSDLDLTEVHGFLLADGVNGPITQIDVPGAPGTAAYGLDDRGRLLGIFDNPNATRNTRSAAQGAPFDTLPLGLRARVEAPMSPGRHD